MSRQKKEHHEEEPLIPSETQETEGAEETQEQPATSEVSNVESHEPAPSDDRGDISRNVVEWRLANWPTSEFKAMYPDRRLKEAGLDDLI